MRRRDDQPVFDNRVFHLVGESSGEEQSQREGEGEGTKEPAREGVKPTLRERNQSATLTGKKKPEGVKNSAKRKEERKKKNKTIDSIKELAERPFNAGGLRFADKATRGESLFCLKWIL